MTLLNGTKLKSARSQAQALLLSGRPLVCIPVYIHKGGQALSVIVYVT